MASTHQLSLILAVFAGICFLLATFGIQGFGPVALTPLGLLFFVASTATCHHAHAG